jgi:hypothetical protein
VEEVDMTEALSKWVSEQTVSKVVEEWEHVHPLSRVAAEFWLSAFVQEVERILKDVSDRTNIGSAKAMRTTWKVEIFENLVREFGLDGEK